PRLHRDPTDHERRELPAADPRLHAPAGAGGAAAGGEGGRGDRLEGRCGATRRVPPALTSARPTCTLRPRLLATLPAKRRETDSMSIPTRPEPSAVAVPPSPDDVPQPQREKTDGS